MSQDTMGGGTKIEYMGGARSRLPGNPNEWQHVSGTDFYRRNNLRRECSCPACSPSMGAFAWVLAATLGVLVLLAFVSVLLVEYSIGGW